ncbi:FAD-dependent monooxygenase [Pseudonocardia sp. C8]|uniref:FAD-dependent oxidoreductase n=1 Tax=Pseudonocardia sp. C8 TaxID=2762759 RepID=UPI00164308C9|nr:FAD-dependent monooxygenase [Pseudonocardia sp. C8]MBC3192208.1 FAD-dependent monooxygenase [Pseudonocardia sp. C8]
MTGTTDRRPARIGGRAVVVGASMAGLCAARVLSERFDHVLLIDRDALPDGPVPRGRVPQGRHPHLLLVAGARLLERWFPGIVDELEADGAVDLDLCGDFYWHQGGGVARRPSSPLRGPAMSRPFLEHTVRTRVEALPRVTVRDRTTVAGLHTDTGGARITGVQLDDGTTAGCNLVIDATGRQARSLAWLAPLGFTAPPTSVVAVDTRYVSQVYRRGDDPHRGWKAAAVIDEPAARRLAMALPVEGDRWIVLLGGLNGESPPTGETERLAYARSMPSPVIAEIMETAEPVGARATHRFRANQRRHVERMRRVPIGWAPLGDAVCSFDPIYGQGMTSAVLQADALGACLDRSGAVDRAFTRRYLRSVGRVVAGPWSVAVGGDFVYEGTTGPKPPGTDLLNRYMDRVTIAAQHDDAVALRLNEVIAMVRAPEALLAPGFVLRVLSVARRGPAGTTGAPTPGRSAATPRRAT